MIGVTKVGCAVEVKIPAFAGMTGELAGMTGEGWARANSVTERGDKIRA